VVKIPVSKDKRVVLNADQHVYDVVDFNTLWVHLAEGLLAYFTEVTLN